MDYTGERCIPGKRGLELLEMEHRTRYALARRYVDGRDVLDLATGSGYGANILAETARTVVGTDISEEALAYARNAFARENTTFVQGNLFADDFIDSIRAVHAGKFHCITAFEILEHLETPLRLLAIANELLEDDGVFIVSTPNIDYPFELDNQNPHHVCEYTQAAFEQLLSQGFAHVRVQPQRVHMLSTIGDEDEAFRETDPWRSYGLEHAKFFVAICAKNPDAIACASAGLITSDAHLKYLQIKLHESRTDQAVKGRHIKAIESHLSDARAEHHRLEIDHQRLESAHQRIDAEHRRIDVEHQRIDVEHQRINAVEEVDKQLGVRIALLEKRIKELGHESAENRRSISELRNHPAVRRLLRFGTFGLKLLGLFGLVPTTRPAKANANVLPPLRKDVPVGEPYKAILTWTLKDRVNRDISVFPDVELRRLRTELLREPQETKVSIVMPTYNRATMIASAIDSVIAQSYRAWELIIVDDGSTDNTLEVIARYQAKHANIRVVPAGHEGVSAARNRGLESADGAIVAYLDSDNAWSTDYLLFTVQAMKATGKSTAYSVLRIIDHDAGRAVGYRKRHYDREALLQNNFIDINVFAHERQIVNELGGFDTALRRWVDWDLILRYCNVHVPVEIPFALCDYNKRQDLNQITAKESATYKHSVLNKHLIDWAALKSAIPQLDAGMTSIVIPVFNQIELTRKCVASIERNTGDVSYEIILVDNGCNEASREGLKALAAASPHARIVQNFENYYFALGNNLGVARARGAKLVLLNNDTEVTPSWLTGLLVPLERDAKVGVVGAKLLYPDGSIQHAGMVFSAQSKIPTHIYRGAQADAPCVNKARDFQAVTGACMAMRTADYIALGGLDARYANGCEDIDFCLRMQHELGKTVHYAPTVVLTHHEGKTEGRSKSILYNRETLVSLWGGKIRADDQQYYHDDGFRVREYVKPGREPDGDTAIYAPVLESSDGQQASVVTHSPEKFSAAQSLLGRIGVISIWHVRGIAVQAKQYIDILEAGGFEAFVLSRWEDERFDNSGVMHHPRVSNGGDDPSAERAVAWAREHDLDAVLFMEVHPNDWKRVHALKAAGVRVICYENLDILRKEHFEKYAVFDHFLFSNFYTQQVFAERHPGLSSLVLSHGIPESVVAPYRARAARVPGAAIQCVHVAGWGGLNNRKGTDTLIQAFHQATSSNILLHLYTQVSVEAYGEACAEILRTDKRIVVHQGTLENIFEAYRDADLLLWPSKREGLGLPIVEALACGVPVLITDGYLMKQWIVPGEHGYLCPAVPEQGRMYLPEMQVKAETLAAMIDRIAASPEDLQRMREQVARDHAVWVWDWQSKVFCDELARIVADRQYRPDAHFSYVPEFILDFERRRERANAER